ADVLPPRAIAASRTRRSRVLALVFLPPCAVLAALLVFGLVHEVDPSAMTRDIASVANVHPLSGVLSNLGVLLWSMTAGICLFAASLVHRSPRTASGVRSPVGATGETRFLVSAGLLSTYLMLDDFFLAHEVLLPEHLGIPESWVCAGILLWATVHVLVFRRIGLRHSPWLLACSVAFLGLSIAVDLVLEPWLWRLRKWIYFVEDGAKWLGIATWFAYHARLAFRCVRSAEAIPEGDPGYATWPVFRAGAGGVPEP